MFPFISKATRLRVPAHHGTINVQRVRIEKRRVRRFMTRLATPLAIYFVVTTSSYWMPEAVKDAFQSSKKKVESRAEEVKKKEVSEKNVEQFSDEWKEQNARLSKLNESTKPLDEQSERNLRNGIVPNGRNAGFKYPFFPIPFLINRKPAVPYVEADAEWKEYVKLYKDKARQHALKKLVVHETLKSLQMTHEGRLQLRRLDSRISAGVLLDVFIPLSRPPAYEMQGLLLDPKGARMTGKPFSEQTGQRIDRIMNPTVLMGASYRAGLAFLTVLYRQAKLKVSEKVSKDKGQNPSTSPDPHFETWLLASSDFQELTATKHGRAPSSSTTSKSDTDPDDKVTMYFNREAVAKVIPTTAKDAAKVIFLREFLTNQSGALQTFPTGACAFYGTVDFKGRRGTIRNYVWATYLPRDDKFYTPILVTKMEFLPDPVEWNRKKLPAPPNPTNPLGVGRGQTAAIQELEKDLVHMSKHLLEKERGVERFMEEAKRDFDALRIRIAEDAKRYEEMSKSSVPAVVKEVLGTTKEEEEEEEETIKDAAPEGVKVAEEPKEREGNAKKE